MKNDLLDVTFHPNDESLYGRRNRLRRDTQAFQNFPLRRGYGGPICGASFIFMYYRDIGLSLTDLGCPTSQQPLPRKIAGFTRHRSIHFIPKLPFSTKYSLLLIWVYFNKEITRSLTHSLPHFCAAIGPHKLVIPHSNTQHKNIGVNPPTPMISGLTRQPDLIPPPFFSTKHSLSLISLNQKHSFNHSLSSP